MDKEQAINLLDQAVAQMALSRKDHELLMTAIQTLKGGTDATSNNSSGQ